MSVVVVEKLPRADYVPGCVTLPHDYGKPSWDERPEVRTIRQAVFACLDTLDAQTGIGGKLKGKPVLVKPNLVMVYSGMGTVKREYPESTDPRVLDAVLLWALARASKITIVESSGRGSPTRVAFAVAGIDRMARHRGCGLVALEEEACDRYILPKASVQKEILVPRIFSSVIRGEACYISVPKLKTNLYTQVTLGFKNAMGVIPYNLRQRNHNHAIDRKLVEMLYLFKPDIVLVDGVVGGEGECPAPVDPVDSRMIIAGDQAVETDRVATRLMGFDPATIPLMRIADELGFGSPTPARVIGDCEAVKFRPADRSLLSERVAKDFPGVRVLYGIDKGGIDWGGSSKRSVHIDANDAAGAGLSPGSESRARLAVDPETVRRMESSCMGGCVASTRFGLAMLESEGFAGANRNRDRGGGTRNSGMRPGTIVIGGGILVGERLWFDKDGLSYNRDDIGALPGKKAVIGSCGAELGASADYFVEGCMPLANAPHAALHAVTGTACRVLSARNRHIPLMLHAILKTRAARVGMIRTGIRLDVPFQTQDAIVETRPLSGAEKELDYVPWPLPAVTDRAEMKRLVDFEDDSTAASLLGVFVPRIRERILWRIQEVVATVATLGPFAIGAGLAILGRPGAGIWLAVFAGIEVVHACELPAALRALAAKRPQTGVAYRILRVMTTGYPAWIPWKSGVFDRAEPGTGRCLPQA